MARSTTRSLAGKAASAARKAVGRRSASSGGAKNGATAAKKAAAKAAPPAKKAAAQGSPAGLPVLPGEKPWTKAEVDEVLSDLREDRARVVRTLTAQEAELAGLMRDAGDGAGHDQADMGATSFERDQELT